jgi:hypothetical protein
MTGTIGIIVKGEIESIKFSILSLLLSFLLGTIFGVSCDLAIQFLSIRSKSPHFLVLSIITLFAKLV